MKKHWTLLPIAASTSLMPLVACANQPDTRDEYEKLLDAYKKMLVETINTDAYKGKTAQEIISSELLVQHYVIPFACNAFYFKNIDYTNGDKAIWPAHQHIVRTLQIAVLAEQKNDAALKDLAVKLTYYWLCNNFHNENWWFNVIGVPRDFSNLAIFVYKNLTQEQQQKMLEWIHHGSLKYVDETHSYTGTNMFWVGDITLKSGLLAKDESEIETMWNYVTPQIFVDKDEGFQSDGSYFQHGRQLYTGGYGRQGAILLSKIASAFIGSKYELDETKLKIVVDFAVDGIKYFTHKKNFTWQCMGRTHVRKQAAQFDGGTTDLGVINELKYFGQLPNCPRKDELNDLIDRWQHNQPSFEGFKYFPKSCFLAYQNDGVYIGFKGTKADLKNTEAINGENELSHNLGFGVNTCVMQNGDEYADISPVWQYDRIPGTTTIDETDEELSKYKDIGKEKTGTFYSGESEDKKVAFVSQQTSQNFHEGDLKYIVTSFVCDDGVAVLGSNIKYEPKEGKSDKAFTTTVEQCDIGTQAASLSPDQKTLTHGNVVYKNIDASADAKLRMSSEPRIKSWSRNNKSYAKEDMMRKMVLTVTINNDKMADKSNYAYAIQPKAREDKVFKVAVNTEKAQGIVLPDGKIAVLFLQDGSFEYGGHTYSGNKGEFKIFTENK